MSAILQKILNKYGVYLLFILFFIFYSTLSIVRHNHFLSAWDLSVVDQITWKYSNFLTPITTIHAYSGTSIFTDHIELIYLVLSPLYWLWSDARILILAQAFFISLSVVPIYLLAKKLKLNQFLNLSLCLSYLLFYGIQTAIWNDVHSIVFGASFLPWFIYFLDRKNLKFASLFFILAILSKEDVAFLTLAISFTYFIVRRTKIELIYLILSVTYLFLIFFVFYPNFTTGYRFEHPGGFFNDLSLNNYVNTADKRETLFYSLAWFGFTPIFSPLFLIPTLADISHYFILGQTVTTAQGIFLHYRVTLAPLLILPTIIFLSKNKRLNNKYIGVYFLTFALFITYYLHFPITYLTKSWFWQTPGSVYSIEKIISKLPPDASVVSQVNIIPHIAHRKEVFTLWAETKNFNENSPCDKKTCPWFRWDGKPEYLIADTATNWDIRQLFQNNEDFNSALRSSEKLGVIKLYKEEGTTKLFKVLKNPKEI